MLDDAEGAQSSRAPHKHPVTIAMSFTQLIDEPESKKLAAQSDLDSAKALCEFPLLLYAWFTFGSIMYLLEPCICTVLLHPPHHVSQSIINPKPLHCTLYSLPISLC